MARLGIARSVIKSLVFLWKDRSLGLQLKRQCLVQPVAMYGCES